MTAGEQLSKAARVELNRQLEREPQKWISQKHPQARKLLNPIIHTFRKPRAFSAS